MVKPSEKRRAQPRRRPTMADVARIAGVSPTTVSFVINERPDSGIPEETRRRVLDTVRELGYQPNRQARNLRLRRTRQLGLHIPDDQLDFHNVFAVSLLQPLMREADRHGQQILLFSSGDDVVDRLADLVAGNGVDGFLITDSSIDDPRARYLAGAGMPFASFGRTGAELPQSWVDVDNTAGIGAIVDYLVAKGHEHIAYVGGLRAGYWYRERLAGFQARMTHHRVDVPPDWTVETSGDRVQADVLRLLHSPRRPTAIVTPSDVIAVEAVRAIRSAGLRVGVDVAVTGFDGGPLQWLTDPALTTVRVPLDRVAAALVERCLGEIEGSSTGDPGVYLPTEVVIGDSA